MSLLDLREAFLVIGSRTGICLSALSLVLALGACDSTGGSSENDVKSEGDDPQDDDDTSEDESSKKNSKKGDVPEDSSNSDGERDPSGDEALSDYCKDVSKWEPAWIKLEDEILKLVNEFRAKGADCKSAGKFEPAGPVTFDTNLRCAARLHSKDMGEKNYFAHTNKERESPLDRIEKSGFKGLTAGENIAAGNADAQATMQQWIGSDSHCSNMMNPKFTKLGVGYYPKSGSMYRHYWTQNFGG